MSLKFFLHYIYLLSYYEEIVLKNSQNMLDQKYINLLHHFLIVLQIVHMMIYFQLQQERLHFLNIVFKFQQIVLVMSTLLQLN